MKKINKLFVLAIASMAALASCQKAGEIDNNFQPKVLKAVFEDGLSKTALAENFQIQWSESDAITGFDLDGTNHTSTSTKVSEDKLQAAFTFKDLTIEDDLLLVMYPADSKASINNTAVISTTLPEVQNAVAGSFDPKANLALADGGVENVKFLNGGALLAFDIKNDNIAKIELESASYENFAGPATLNFDADNMPLLQSTYASDLHKVTLQGNFEKGKTYYAVVFPSEYSSLKMVFTRNDGKTATYTNSNSLSVARNSITTIWKGEIADSKWEDPAPGEEYFVKVTEEPADWTGEYLIVYEDGNVAFDGSLSTLDAVSNTKIVTIEDDMIEATDAMKAIKFTVDYKNGSSTVYSMKSASGYFISGTTINAKAANGLKSATTDANYEISFAMEGGSAVVYSKSSDQNMPLRYNPTEGQTRFRFYKSGQESISLYKLHSAGPVVTKYNVTCATVEGGTISASLAKAAEGETVTLTATPDTGYEFASWAVTNASTSAAITVSEDNKFTMPAANVNVSATFKTVAIPDKTIAEFIVAKGGNCYLTGVVSSITNTTYGNYTLTDASGSIIVYGTLNQGGEPKKFAELGIIAGDKIKVLASEYELYGGTTDEAKNVIFVEIVEHAPKYAVNIASGIANGTVTVDFNEATEGQTVTITATPASGYKVKSVSAKKTASGTALTVTANKFTMPAEAVTVSAEFEEDGGSKTKDYSPKYSLNPIAGSNNSYTGNCDVIVNGITWNVTGNAQQVPWRLGGKSISNTDRAVYSKTAYAKDLWKVSLTVGSASSITVNSLKLVYSTKADFSDAKEMSGTFSESSTIDFEGDFPANCYYKFVFNLTVSGTTNRFVQFSKVEFFGYNEN